MSNDCWGVVAEFIGNIKDLNNFELACKQFRVVVIYLYSRHFGKKMYKSTEEFINSSSFSSPFKENRVQTLGKPPEQGSLWIHCKEVDTDGYENSKDDLTLFHEHPGYLKDYYSCRIICKNPENYSLYQKESFWSGDENTEYYDNDDGEEKYTVDKSFKIFVQKIKGYFFI